MDKQANKQVMHHSGIREYNTDGNVIGSVEDWCIVVSCGGMWE
jgi:hypothetical protein